MATVLPPPATPVPNQPGAAPAHTATIPNPPPALIELPVGSTLNAQLLALPRPNVAEVQTNLGTMLLHTNVKLPEGASFQLQIRSLIPQLQVLLNALPQGQAGTAQPVQTGAAQRSTPASSGTATPATSQQAGQAAAQTGSALQSVPADGQIKLDIGAVLKATVVRLPGATNAGPGTTPGGLSATTQTGSTLSLATQASQAGGTTAAAPAQTATTSPGLQVGQQIVIRILGIVPRGQSAGQAAAPSSAITGLQAGQIFQGSVKAMTQAGQPVVDTPIGQLIVDTKSPIPLGSRLSIEVVSTPGQTGLSLSISAGAEIIYATRDWPALAEALAHIQAAAGGQAQAAPPVPQANGALTANLLFFLSALRGGDVSQWLGDQNNALLQQDWPDTANRLSEEFAQISRAFGDQPANDWRSALIPFYNGALLEQLYMHLRGRSGTSDEEGSSDETARFLIDVELSRLGRVQLDGLVKAEGKKFDLIVRTERPFPRLMRRDINQIFVDFNEATGVTGGVVFQADNKFTEVPMPSFSDGIDRQISI